MAEDDVETPLDESEPAASEAEAIEVDIASLAAERDQFKDIALRLQADFENYRKRVARDTVDEVARGTGRLVESLLPVLDACEGAFAHGADGVEPVWSALIGALQKAGLEAIDCQGKAFDPAEHEAVVHEPGEGEPMVSEVFRTGYRWQGKVLRPAMVKVRG
ncbi:MAG: grpE [Acidimicrobiia bacterium]|nr:grpE [Acidimicrobiia bacterium]